MNPVAMGATNKGIRMNALIKFLPVSTFSIASAKINPSTNSQGIAIPTYVMVLKKAFKNSSSSRISK